MNRNIIVLLFALIFLIIGAVGYNIEHVYGENTFVLAKSEFGQDNYIQAPHDYIQASHNDMKFTVDSRGLVLQDIDGCEIIKGSSMRPTKFTGNTICYKDYYKWMKNSLKEGQEIIFIGEDGERVNHRIDAIYDDYIITQGDNKLANEEVEFDNIKGVVLANLYT